MKNVKIKNILLGPRGAPTLSVLAFVASTAMLTVIQAPISLSPLAWVSLVPFILACSPDAKPRRLALVTYIISLCYWLGNLYWICPVTVLGWIAFCLYTALLWPILALCLRYCRIKKIPLFLAVPILVVGAERLQGLFLGGFFWRFLAHSQYQNITLIQIADIFGAGGVSFLIAMVNGLLAELILDTLRRTPCGGCLILDARFWKSVFRIGNLFKIGLVATALVAAIVYGRWRISQEDQFVESGPVAASLQSNVPQSVKRTFQAGKQIFDELMKQSKASAQTGAELIVWPETMVQAILDTDVWPFLVSADNERTFDRALSDHSKDTAFVLVGTYGGRIQQAQDTNISLAKYNSAFLYRPDGLKDDSRYDKIHLVPFGEFLPFRKSWPWLYNFLMKFTPYNYDYSLDAGSKYTVFEMTSPVRSSPIGQHPTKREISNGAGGQDKGISHKDIPASAGTSLPLQKQGSQSQLDISKKQKNSSCLGALVAEETSVYKFGVMICYEDTVPAIARKFALDEQGQKRLDWLVNISNDGWFVRFKSDPVARRANGKVSPSTELPQHAAICAFRAVENRLAVLRSVNTGISCLIDSFGRIRNGFLDGTLPHKAMARTGMAGWFTDKIPIDRRVTFFNKYGQWLDFSRDFCLILLIIVPASIKLFRIKKYRTRLSGKPNEKHTQKS